MMVNGHYYDKELKREFENSPVFMIIYCILL